MIKPRTRKSYLRGSHRTVAPDETLRRFERFGDQFEITRLANVTGLDYIGIPVFMAMRPNARSLSVSQGKGLDEASARASAFMESAELWHAENAIPSLEAASWREMQKQRPVVDYSLLPRINGSRLQRDRKIRWTEATDILSGQGIPVPFDLVHADYRMRRGVATTPFLETTNGLASGNHPLEATCAGLCEVIERDGLACWQYRSVRDRAARRLLLESVSDKDCRSLLRRLSDCRIDVAAWNLTTDVGVSIFLCRISEASNNERSQHGDFWGCGCHSTREVALIRAITEAVQTRLTYIAGSRDDLRRRQYSTLEKSILDVALDLWELASSKTSFGNIPSESHASFEQDIESLLEHLHAAGVGQVLRVDLTDDRFGIPVVRIIVPGLEVWTGENREAIGTRARLLKKKRQ